jgi:hypothetical protein
MSHSDCFNSLKAKGLRLFFALSIALFLSPNLSRAQCTLICNDGLQISLDATGQVQIMPEWIAPNANTTCPGPLQLRLFEQSGYLISGTTLNCNYIGQTITAQVRHLASGNSCSGTLELHDFLPPTISCTDKFIFCNQDPSPAALGSPTMADNCTPTDELIFSYFDNIESLPCGTLQNGHLVTKRIDRTWFVTDAFGNSNSCEQKIWLKHITLTNLTFPPNLDGLVNPSLNCDQDPNDLALTGQPTVGGIPIDNSPDCEFGVVYSDQIINICPPAGYSILRTWTAVDFCTSQITNRIQIIKVEDKTPPVIAPLENITVGTDGFLCTGTVELPPAEISDDCSAVTVTPSWAYGAGFGPFTGISLGTHIVTYTATDACGNSKTATLSVTVNDSSPPQPICAADVQVSLSAGGVGFLNAGSVGLNSFDNCGPVTLTLSRDDSFYVPTLEVTCADIGTTLTVLLKVTDAVGLENFCDTEVNVRDFLKPDIQCPANANLTCLQNHEDLQVTGQATASDNCALQSLDFYDINLIGPCNIGSVTRMWKATDEQGNTRTCAQQITLAAVSDVSVTFPADVTVSACADSSDVLPPATGEPVTSGQHCFPLSVTYIDQILQNSPASPFCYRILRYWKVIDFCVYDINGGSSGIWEDVQLIDVVDDAPPVLALPADLTVNADQPGCLAQVALPDVTANDCDGQISISNNGIYASSTGANASGLYPLGVHQIVFSAADNCGNITQQTLTVTVQDLVPPKAVCKNGLVVNLNTAGKATLDATLLDDNSSDHCSASANLVFAVSPDSFNCQTLGIQQVTLTVTDESGNAATCSATVTVTDPAGACLPPPPPGFVIEGTIRTETGAPVAEIPLTLLGDGFTAVAECDAAGHYIFEDVPGNNLYSLRPQNNAKWLNGLTTFDLVLISKHILGLDTLDSPFKLIAADANRSGTVTTFDIVQLRKVILGLLDTVPGNTSWRFVDAAYTFPDQTNPFGAVFPEQKSYNILTANHTEQNFVGVKIGDINNSVNTADPRSPRDTLFILIADAELLVSETSKLPVRLENWEALEGFQFEIKFDAEKAELQKVEFAKPELLGEANTVVKTGGTLSVSWDNAMPAAHGTNDSILFHLYLTVKKPGATISDVLTIETGRIQSEAYRSVGDPSLALAMRFENTRQMPNREFSALPARPNPFSEETLIPLWLSRPGQLFLTIADISGRAVLEKKSDFPAGSSEWRIRREELPGAGAYYYRVTSGAASVQGGLVLIPERH